MTRRRNDLEVLHVSNPARLVDDLIRYCYSFKVDWKARVIMFVVPGQAYYMHMFHTDYRTRITVSKEYFSDDVYITVPLLTFIQGCFTTRFDHSWLRVNLTQNSVSYEKRERPSNEVPVG